MPHLIKIGIDHSLASVCDREGYVRNERWYEDLQGTCEGIVWLTTCHRTEAYLCLDVDTPEDVARSLWERLTGQPSSPHLVILEGDEAARHVFRLAAGLLSAVPGEPQILGQIRQAVEEAETYGMLSPTLRVLFQEALHTGRLVRTHTALGRGDRSTPAVAVRLAVAHWGSLKGRTAVVLGQGSMGDLARIHLKKQGALVRLVSRFATEPGTYTRDRLQEALEGADVLITAARADEKPIVEVCHLPANPLFCVDLGVPHNVHPDALSHPGFVYRDVDALDLDAARVLDERRTAIPEAERWVLSGLQRYAAKLALQPAEHTIRTLYQRAEEHAHRLLERYHDAHKEELEPFARALSKRLLHDLTHALRTRQADPETVARWFALPPDA